MERDNRKILIVDDEPDLLKVLAKKLGGFGYEVALAQNGREALDQARKILPDLILLDIMMPGMDGREVKMKLSQDESTRDIPVIFLTAKTTTADKVEGLYLGAEDFVTKPYDIEELNARIEKAIRRKRQFEIAALTDPLTGLANSRFFKKELHTFFRLGQRYDRCFCLALMDVDDFKKINDVHGHKTGDSVLRALAAVMREIFRESDILARYGGDEFVVLLSETTEEQARPVMNRLKEMLGQRKMTAEGTGQPVPFTVSIGLAAFRKGFSHEDEIFALADQRMYGDKNMKRTSARDKKSVLIVDDEEDIRKSVVFRLRKTGFEVFAADDGEAGLAQAKKFRPDLIILDLMLPKLTGEEVCKAVREDDDPVFSKTPIVMVTAKNTDVDRIVGKVIGANRYLTKPYEWKDLVQNINDLIGASGG